MKSNIGVQILAHSSDIFAMAQICIIAHDHQAPFWFVVVVLLLLFLQGQTVTQGKKQTTTWPIYLMPPIFLPILDPL